MEDYQVNVQDLEPKEQAKMLEALEKKMYGHAKDLEFEEAAAVRDQIEKMRASMLGIEG